jgi:hypothetical protein
MSAVLSLPSRTVDSSGVAAAEAANRASLTASDRLALSRERLRQAMSDLSATQGEVENRDAGRRALAWLDSLKSIPGAPIVIEFVRNWWRRNPLRIAGMAGADAAQTIVQPMAKRNPLTLVLGAFLLGGLLAWGRPWRWIVKPALFAGLLPPLFFKAMAHVPVESWISVFATLAQQPRRVAPTPEEPASRAGHARAANK